MKTKDFLCALSDRMRFYTLTALQVFLCTTILPALLVVIVILWIDEVKD